MTGVRRARAGWFAVVVAVAGAAFWAGGRFVEPPGAPADAPTELGYEVVDGEVEYAQSFAGRAQWDRSPGTPAAVSGTVTSVDVPADGSVEAGQVIMTVDLRPVVTAAGKVPAFRSLQRGDRGLDVSQLQGLLRSSGHDVPDSGIFDARTGAAVRAWQREVGFPVDGVVAAGDVLFLPTVPSRLALADGVRVGSVVAAGDTLFDVLSEAPEVTVSLDAAQVATVPQDAPVTVRTGDHAWDGVIASSTTLEDGTLLLTLTAADGTAVCGADCAAVPVTGALNVTVDVIVTPLTSGPVVPTSAVRTTPTGQTVVRTPDGTDRPVQVVASARGLAVLEGVVAGEVVLVPALADGS